MPGLGSIRTFRGHRGWEKFKLYFVGFSHLPFVPPGPLRLLDHYECQTLATMLTDFLKEALECLKPQELLCAVDGTVRKKVMSLLQKEKQKNPETITL